MLVLSRTIHDALLTNVGLSLAQTCRTMARACSSTRVRSPFESACAEACCRLENQRHHGRRGDAVESVTCTVTSDRVSEHVLPESPGSNVEIKEKRKNREKKKGKKKEKRKKKKKRKKQKEKKENKEQKRKRGKKKRKRTKMHITSGVCVWSGQPCSHHNADASNLVSGGTSHPYTMPVLSCGGWTIAAHRQRCRRLTDESTLHVQHTSTMVHLHARIPHDSRYVTRSDGIVRQTSQHS